MMGVLWEGGVTDIGSMEGGCVGFGGFGFKISSMSSLFLTFAFPEVLGGKSNLCASVSGTGKDTGRLLAVGS